MPPSGRRVGLIGLFLVACLATGAVVIKGCGITARRDPLPLETTLARAAWRFLVPASARDRSNPLPDDPDVLRRGLEHWADHCATCHANDGSGDTEVGRNLFPQAPDMRLEATQSKSDGELFYAIEQGIPFTGMPAWSTGSESGEVSSWELVRFIRHLPELTADELARMEELNPKSRADLEREREIEAFLGGGSR